MRRGNLRAAVSVLRLRSTDALRDLSRWALPLLCVTLWSDIYAVNAPQAALYQEVKVELCELANRVDVVVSVRLYRDVATVRGLEQVEVRPWEELARRARLDPPITPCPTKEELCVSPSSPPLSSF